MIKLRQKWELALLSTISLLPLFVLIQFLQWCFMQLGAYISDFEGQVIWNKFTIVATSETWNFEQVMWIYLSSFAGFLVLYIFLNLFPKQPFKMANWIMLNYAWAFLLVLLMVFFMPIIEIIHRQGIYHALNWLSFSRHEQAFVVIVLFFFLIYKLFRISTLFSTSLKLPSFQMLEKKQIGNQLLYLWYLPFLILSLMVFTVSGFSIPFPVNYFLVGIATILFINSWIIRLYNVIVK